MKLSLVRSCRKYRYKNGAFATAVTTTTSPVDDLNIIINSPLLTSYERRVFEQVKKAVISVRNKEARGENLHELHLVMGPYMAFLQVIEADMSLRGLYVPPTMGQIMGQDGTIKETILIDNDGNETHYEGGEPCVVPGAPQAFNEAQRRAHGNFFKPKEKDDGDHNSRSIVPSISFP